MIVLLTLGCEWRWYKNDITNWYPNAILLRQVAFGDWTDPIEKLTKLLTNTNTNTNTNTLLQNKELVKQK